MHASLLLDSDSRPQVRMRWTLAEVLALRPAQRRVFNALVETHAREHGALSLLADGVVPAYLRLALWPCWDRALAAVPDEPDPLAESLPE
jgi:hypothetical protein